MSRDYLSAEAFQEAIADLEEYYNKNLPPAVKSAWYEYLKTLSAKQMKDALSTVFVRCKFMPTAEEIKEFAGYDADRFPGENYMDAHRNYGLVLGSAESRLKDELDRLTPEELLARRRRLANMMKNARNGKSDFHLFGQEEGMAKIAIDENFDYIFQHKRATLLFASEQGLENLVKSAIAWAQEHYDRVRLIYAKDQELAVDMQLIQEEDEDLEF